MKLNLRKIIDRPGEILPFAYDFDLSHMQWEQISRVNGTFPVTGQVENSAGILRLSCEMPIDLIRLCDRCTEPVEIKKILPVHAVLASSLQDEDNSDMFLLQGDFVDLDEILLTAFVLCMESKFLCSPDCRGLCSRCGFPLNNGPCGCKIETDPRLAALSRLLDGEEDSQ